MATDFSIHALLSTHLTRHSWQRFNNSYNTNWSTHWKDQIAASGKETQVGAMILTRILIYHNPVHAGMHKEHATTWMPQLQNVYCHILHHPDNRRAEKQIITIIKHWGYGETWREAKAMRIVTNSCVSHVKSVQLLYWCRKQVLKVTSILLITFHLRLSWQQWMYLVSWSDGHDVFDGVMKPPSLTFTLGMVLRGAPHVYSLVLQDFSELLGLEFCTLRSVYL